MAGDVGPLDYAGRTPTRPASNWGEGDERKALAEGCAAVVLLAVLLPVGSVALVAFGLWCLLVLADAFR